MKVVVEELNLFPETVTATSKAIFLNFGLEEAKYAMKAIAKLLYGTDDYHQLATQILAFNCMAEIALGVIHIFEIMTPQRNIIGTVILWQFIRTRHMLMDDMKQAFARLNGAITGYIGNIPVIGGIWKLIVKSASWISKPPDVNAASSGSSRCTVM